MTQLQALQKDINAKNQAYQQKELQLTYKLYDFIERQAVNVGGCDPVCVDKCTDVQVYPIKQVGNCLSACDCNGGAIQVTDGTYDKEQIALYSVNI